MKYEPNVGQTPHDHAQRDAVHFAVIPVKASEYLYPGTRVRLLLDGTAVNHGNSEPVGIVDPFRVVPVEGGEQFWLFLMPNTIRSLRHDWEHPAFPKGGVTEVDSKKWLRDFLKNADCPSYDTVVDTIRASVKGKKLDGSGIVSYGGGETYLFFSGMDAHSSIPPDFWYHLERAEGIKVPESMQATSFSCSC